MAVAAVVVVVVALVAVADVKAEVTAVGVKVSGLVSQIGKTLVQFADVFVEAQF